MLSNQVFNIFRKPQNDESIQKVEWRTYYPYVKSFRNNDVIEININQSDAYDALYESLLFISGKVVRTQGGGRVKFVNNAGAFMFQSVSYEQSGKELEAVREVGIVSTVRGFLTYTDDDIKHLATSGWMFPDNIGVIHTAHLTFNMLIPLKHFLNIFNDYQCVSYGKHTIRLVRAGNDSNCFKIEEINALPTTPKTEVTLEIENIELKVKRLFPHDQIKLQLLKAIKADAPILMPFRKWELHMLPALTAGATNEIWAVKTSSFLESPRYVIVCFQKDRDYTKVNHDPTVFSHLNITNITLTLNGDNYPKENMHLNFGKGNFSQAYFNYAQFGFAYKNTNHHSPLLNTAEFAAKSLFVIDCSRRDESIKSSSVDVKLEIEASEGFPANTRAYCIIVHDTVIEHLPLSEIVKKWN